VLTVPDMHVGIPTAMNISKEEFKTPASTSVVMMV
jgi:hypothetical protein